MRKFPGIVFFLITFFFFAGCKKFEYSPYQVENRNTPINLNSKNVEKLLAEEHLADDTVTILITGDSQRFYDDLVLLVKKANQIPDIDLLILAGDISDFSLLQEFHWIHQRLKKLIFPYLCVIGNHDLLANGTEIYEKIFGERNFSFLYMGYKFILYDNNALEYGFNGKVPDLNWLSSQMDDDSAKWLIGVSHVPPFSGDFDRTLEEPCQKLFASDPRFILSVHGHKHNTSDSYYYNNHVRYIVTNAVNKRAFIILKMIDGNISKKIVHY